MVLHVSVCFLMLYEIVKTILQFVSIIFYIFLGLILKLLIDLP